MDLHRSWIRVSVLIDWRLALVLVILCMTIWLLVK